MIRRGLRHMERVLVCGVTGGDPRYVKQSLVPLLSDAALPPESAMDVKLGRDRAKSPLPRPHRGGPGDCGGSLAGIWASILSAALILNCALNRSCAISYQMPGCAYPDIWRS